MAIETEVGSITAFDNMNGQGVLATVEFKDYDLRHEGIRVFVKLPLDKDASLAEIEARAIDNARQQLKKLVSGF
ncbi:hypothetical protein CGN00_06820 [Salmonella enterica]|uniref:hypothetical protein n=1 Tax=Salmonella enterica TaxID=28901 RepID=UPI000505D5E0|nr:hypothetical protein [Salmonella enterica]EBA2371797.1 hypothetical protein [Salmonella enterica subsp. enterica serovar Dublin]EBG0082147.1 hypothetical protein [Salmonella enterica subsp. enterica serovar Poona]EBP9658810.1 hypothetical protein [Salmonella enterica subsp. enterica]ECD4946938.1 hypothetical protein [Salmonella enterica subsp. enterica serovar Muenchen]ECK7111234.1 hypothetical protein [Salmonella enterica subsp. enterica serovar Braenderup]EDV1318028.1 hypothetical protei